MWTKLASTSPVGGHWIAPWARSAARRSPCGRSSRVKLSSSGPSDSCSLPREPSSDLSSSLCSRHSSVTSLRDGTWPAHQRSRASGVKTKSFEQAIDREHADQLSRDRDRARQVESNELHHHAAIDAEHGLGHLHTRLTAVALKLALVRCDRERLTLAPVHEIRSPRVETRRELAGEPTRFATEAHAQVRTPIPVADEEPVVGKTADKRFPGELAERAGHQLIGDRATRIHLHVEPFAPRCPHASLGRRRRQPGGRAAGIGTRGRAGRPVARERNGELDQKASSASRKPGVIDARQRLLENNLSQSVW